MSDVLDRATAVLRSQSDGDNRQVAGSDAWIRDGLITRQTRHARRTVWLTIGLVLASGVGWAAITGRLTASSSNAAPDVRPTANLSPRPRSVPARPSQPLVPTAPAQETRSEPVPVSPRRAAPTHVAESPSDSQSGGTALPFGRADGGGSAVERDRYAAYRTAHRLHFHGADPNAALAAWTRFLALAPDGTLADEARYLSAICLIRLGRIPEATTVLDGLAAPTSQSTRRDDARRQLDRLQSHAASSTDR